MKITRIQQDHFLLDWRLGQEPEMQPEMQIMLVSFLAFSCAFLNSFPRTWPRIFSNTCYFSFFQKRRSVQRIQLFEFNGIEAFQHCVTSRRNQRRRWSDFVAQVRCQTLCRTNTVSVLRLQYSVFRSWTCPHHNMSTIQTMCHLLNGLWHTYAWIQNAKKWLQIYSVTISTAIMQETWGHCVRAWQCVEKSLRRDALAWRLQWSGAFHLKASNAHAFA